ncbi:MAG: cobalt ECF transporter T component CbiQ [Motiliproteus sp.]
MSELFLLSSQAQPRWLTACDPRVRVLAALLLALVTVSLSQPLVLVIALALVLILSRAVNLGFNTLLKRLLAFESFMLLVLLFIPFSIPGDSILQLGSLTASWQGLERALVIVLRANTVVIGLLSLVGTLEPEVLGHALARLRVPDKLVHLFLLTVRYVSVLLDEYQRLRLAMRARAFVAGSNRHTWRSFGWLIGMLLVRSMHRSQRILAAMKCRGFHGRFYLLDNSVWQTRDSLATGLCVLVLTCLLVLENSL